MTSDQITVYAEKIEHVNRKLTREEIAELVKLVVHAHFTDMGPLCDKKKIPDNFILTETDIYFIDTEFKSFFSESRTPIMNFKRFFPSTQKSDEKFFINEINKYADQHSTFAPLNYYDSDRGNLEYYMKNPPKTEYDKKFFQGVQDRMLRLEYVGAKVAGIYKPNQFSYPVTEILDSKK